MTKEELYQQHLNAMYSTNAETCSEEEVEEIFAGCYNVCRMTGNSINIVRSKGKPLHMLWTAYRIIICGWRKQARLMTIWIV